MIQEENPRFLIDTSSTFTWKISQKRYIVRRFKMGNVNTLSPFGSNRLSGHLAKFLTLSSGVILFLIAKQNPRRLFIFNVLLNLMQLRVRF